VTVQSERLAREIVRADVRAMAATRALEWDEAFVWLNTREELRQLRSVLMRQQMVTGAWWGVQREQDVA
jgi:hypothetical protein